MRRVPADKILVIPIEEEQQKQGLYVAQKIQKKPTQGKVILVGCEVKEVKANDTVLFGPNAGSEIILPDGKHILLREPEIYIINP